MTKALKPLVYMHDTHTHTLSLELSHTHIILIIDITAQLAASPNQCLQALNDKKNKPKAKHACNWPTQSSVLHYACFRKLKHCQENPFYNCVKNSYHF